jgi:cytochrome c-type biogenesis protein CcmH/NrfG
MEKKIYYQDLSEEQTTCGEFFNLAEQYDHEAYNIGNEDLPKVIDQLKGFVKAAPRFLEPYLWLGEIYTSNRRERSADAIFKKPMLKRFK